MSDIPEGFEPLQTASPFNQLLGPYYCTLHAGEFVLGLRIVEKHCNSAGRLHGGVVCAIADVAIGHNIGFELGRQAEARKATQPGHEPPEEPEGDSFAGAPRAPITTVSLSTDFVGGARLGDWVEVRTDVQRAGGTLAFANAYLLNEQQRIARVSAVFRILSAG